MLNDCKSQLWNLLDKVCEINGRECIMVRYGCFTNL